MRILFAGSPGIAVPSLELLADGHEIVAVLTNPDAPRGRSKRPEPTEVAAAAERISSSRQSRGFPPFPILKPERLTAEIRDEIAALEPDLLVAVAYGKIFGPKFLALFPRGGVNLHPSLLPKYRGCAPIPAAILNRDAETGLCVQRLALEMDAGDILAVERVPLDFSETTESLTALAAERGALLLASALAAVEAGTAVAVPQDTAGLSFCGMLKKEDGLLDWTRSALSLDARIRAYHPWPGAFTRHGALVLNILEARPYEESSSASSPSAFAAPLAVSAQPGKHAAAPGGVLGIDKAAGILVQTGDGLLALRRLQYETKKALDWRSFLNGARDFIGSTLGADDPARRAKAEAHETLQ